MELMLLPMTATTPAKAAGGNGENIPEVYVFLVEGGGGRTRLCSRASRFWRSPLSFFFRAVNS